MTNEESETKQWIEQAAPGATVQVGTERIVVDQVTGKLTTEPVKHWSDCAVHSEPAYPAGECDCGGIVMTPEQTLDWLAQQHFDQCQEERPIQDWIRKMKSQLPSQRKMLTDNPTEAMLRAVSDQFDADVSSGIGFNPQTLCRAMLNAK